MIRSATPEDIPQLAQWMQQLSAHVTHSSGDACMLSLHGGDTVSLQAHCRNILADPQKQLLIRERQDSARAFIYGAISQLIIPCTVSRTGMIVMCWADVAFRQQGLLRRLTKAMADWFRNLKIHFAEAHYLCGNTEAEQHWLQLGCQPFRIASRKPLPEDS